jgi:hypothetical protein
VIELRSRSDVGKRSTAMSISTYFERDQRGLKADDLSLGRRAFGQALSYLREVWDVRELTLGEAIALRQQVASVIAEINPVVKKCGVTLWPGHEAAGRWLVSEWGVPWSVVRASLAKVSPEQLDEITLSNFGWARGQDITP